MGAFGHRPGSVRVRTTIAASAVVGLALVLASLALVAQLSRSLTSNVRDVALSRAAAVAAELQDGGVPVLGIGEADDEFVQVLDQGRDVVASSSNVSGRPALVQLEDDDETTASVPSSGTSLEDATFLVVAAEASTPEGDRSVLVGRSLDDVKEATSAVVPSLAVGVPLLVVVVAGVTWSITGRALRPVESIRDEVETISSSGLDRRVPEPGTGDEVARLAVTMNRMLGRLESSQTLQRRFVSDAAHELRSPVASIRQHSEVAIAYSDATSVPELAEVVHRENLRVEGLVDDLLLLARLDEGAPTFEQVDLDDVVLAEAARLGRSTALTIRTPAIVATRVLGDPPGLRRMVRNLADNAAHHAEGEVALSVQTLDGWAVVTVEDDGTGIATEDRERVFERFVRLDDARSRNEGGTGLGLAIVRAVADAHEGDISLDRSSLGGARFVVRVPIAYA